MQCDEMPGEVPGLRRVSRALERSSGRLLAGTFGAYSDGDHAARCTFPSRPSMTSGRSSARALLTELDVRPVPYGSTSRRLADVQGLGNGQVREPRPSEVDSALVPVGPVSRVPGVEPSAVQAVPQTTAVPRPALRHLPVASGSSHERPIRRGASMYRFNAAKLFLVGVLTATSVGQGQVTPAYASTKATRDQLTIGPLVKSATTATHATAVFVANYDASNVTSYALSDNGNAVPNVTISADISSPQGITFDSSGNLWVANVGSVVEFARSKLTQASAKPSIVISSTDTFAGLAFDPHGDLWADGYGSNTVVEYTRANSPSRVRQSPKSPSRAVISAPPSASPLTTRGRMGG